MKISSKILALVIGVFVIFQSCEKSELVKDNTSENEVTFEKIGINDKPIETFIYYIDDNIVTKKTYENYKSTKNEHYIVKSGEKNKKSGEITYNMLAYSTEARYIEYGEKNGINLKGELLFQKHMQQYAVRSGAIKQYAKTGKVSDSYLQYEAAYYDKIFGTTKGNKSLFVQFNKGHNRTGSTAIMFNTLAFMWPGWNNKTSCLYQVGISGGVTLYKKRFYRKRIFHIHFNWAHNVINLYGGSDNATSSAIKHW